MIRTKWTPVIALMVIIALAVTLSYVGCGGSSSSSSGSSAPTVKLGTVVTNTGITTFPQTVKLEEDDDKGFPGQANYWDLDKDFSLVDGCDDQFDGALMLGISGTAFASDQTYSELIFMGPLMGAADGIIVAAVATSDYRAPISGTYSAFLNSMSDSRLMQTINLTNASTPTTLTWSYNYSIDAGQLRTTNTAYFKLVIRNAAGAELETIYSDVVTDTSTSDNVAAVTASLTAYAGQSIVLSFEARYSRYESGDSDFCMIDDISVKGNDGTEYVTNGGFEGGTLTGWITNTPQESQNVTSGSRILEGLTVTRSFYTVPNKLWGRMVDIFENNTISDISVAITYTTDLGNDSSGIIYTSTGTGGRALSTWDGDNDDRDCGWVFGDSDAVSFTSATALNTYDGNQYIYVTHNVTVTAGSRIAIVNFLIMSGFDTYQTASDINAKATAIDAEAVKIANNFWSDVQYRDGMTQEQIDAVLNFPK